MNAARHRGMTTAQFYYMQIGFSRAMRDRHLFDARNGILPELRSQSVKNARWWQSMIIRHLGELSKLEKSAA